MLNTRFHHESNESDQTNQIKFVNRVQPIPIGFPAINSWLLTYLIYSSDSFNSW